MIALGMEFAGMDAAMLRVAILERRAAIREHRDQKGDHRCWLDDYRVWAALCDTPPAPTALPAYDEMMDRCTEFYNHRRSETPDPFPPNAVFDDTQWDEDLWELDTDQLTALLTKTQQAIRTHRDVVGRPRTLEDDRALYALLPELMPADFRLPCREEFLGTCKPGAGCPNFHASHQGCPNGTHNIHRWGPCS